MKGPPGCTRKQQHSLRPTLRLRPELIRFHSFPTVTAWAATPKADYALQLPRLAPWTYGATVEYEMHPGAAGALAFEKAEAL